jgi:hypothetical protein
MKLPFRRKPVPTGRQRIRDDAGPAGAPYAYSASRMEQVANTGRQMNRSTPPRRKGSWFSRFGLVVLLIVCLISVLSVLSLSTAAKVRPLNTGDSSAYIHEQAEYERAASLYLGSSIWNRNKITVNAAGLKRSLQQQFPELANVGITLPLIGHRPIVYIEAAQPALVLNGSNGSYIVDTNGRVLLRSGEMPSLSSRHLPTVTDQSGLTLRPGHQALTPADVSFLQTVVAELAIRHLTVSGATLPPSARELDVSVAGQPYIVKFNLHDQTARQQAGTFLATQAQLAKQNIVPAAYIDVRVGGRAYYK